MGGVLVAFGITVIGAWGVIVVATSQAGAPGCAIGVIGFWSICFIGVLADDPLLGITAFVGTGIGIWLGIVTVNTPVETEWTEPFMFEGRWMRVRRSDLENPDDL